MIKIFSRKSALKTAATHSKGHRIHINKSWFRFCFVNFLLFGIFVVIQWDINLNSVLSSSPDMFGQSSETNMIGNMTVIDINALGDLIVEGFRPVSSQKWNTRNTHGNSRFASQEFISLSNGENMFIKVASCCMRFVGDNFEHPRSILVDDREGEVLIFLTQISFSKLKMPLFVNFEEVSFYLLSPFDRG